MPEESIDEIKRSLSITRQRFEFLVRQSAEDVIGFSKDVAKAIGEISWEEAKEAIIEDFRKKIHEEKSY